ncbi:MFS transporter [Flavobacterium sp. JP2137]|uniref:MFS transporter n=1 Tax=Flavobacterium sp. JP2137 TaxID=3414510 RepID=UPI003D2FBFF5
MNRIWQSYLDSYRGLSKATWILALVMLINRSGAMVIPFLGVYMSTELGFDLRQVGLALSCFGVGAILGSLVGGWMTDKLGHYTTQNISLFLSVPVFILLPYFRDFESLCFAVIGLSFITEVFRPANSASVSYYAKPQNLTRAFSLNRMALNLGFSIGPAMGGFLAAYSYNILFYTNAVMVFLAGLVFFFFFRGRKGNDLALQQQAQQVTDSPVKSAYFDKKYVIFSIFLTIYATCFYQLFSSLPLFYKVSHLLSETSIGLLIAFSGVIVFGFEMIIVHVAEKKFSLRQNIIIGTAICGISFLALLLPGGLPILYFAMFLLCVSEIMVLPFSSTVGVNRSTAANRGSYMAINALAFSAAHVFSPLFGTTIAEKYGFDVLWIATGSLIVVASLGFYWVMKKM